MSDTFYQGRYSGSNTQWKMIEPFLPKPKSGGRPALGSRTVFNANLRILGSGATWRDLPKEYGNWNSIYHKFRKWCELGVFEKILQSLVEESRKYFLAEMDSTFCSRGGKTTKIHALVNEHFQLIGVELSGGNVHDSEMAIKLLSKVTLFCSEAIRNFIFQEKAEACIPYKSNAVVILYKTRNIIERFFNRIKNYRHISTRYDKLSVCFLNFVLLAAVMIQI